MADLENWLLEAAGRTGGSSGRNRQSLPPSKRQHQSSYSDDGSDSKDDDSDDPGYSSRKAPRVQVPLKKRAKNRVNDRGGLDHENEDFGPSLQIDSSDDSDVGSDLYKGEEDREQLAQLTELEREMILSDRAAKKDDKKLHKHMKSRWKNDKKSQPRKDSPPLSSQGLRTSTRSADKSGAKTDALNELRARRMRRDYETQQKVDYTLAGSSGSFRQPGFAALDSSESDSEFHSEDEESTGKIRMDYSDEDGKKPGSDAPSFEDIRSITVRRSKLAKWFLEPFFEELIVGCFIRVGIGVSSGENIYRLCIVQNVDASDPSRQYQFENKLTYKFLSCVWGSENSAARWQMARVSDSPPSEEEFKQWVREVKRTGGRMPSSREVMDKKEAIENINSFVYSAATVKQMLQEKKSVLTRPLNIASEREKLKREKELAAGNNDEAEVERINARLKELEAARKAQAQEKDRKALGLAEMNRKNRFENFRNASGSKRVNTNLVAGEAGYDPFSRRWTRSRNYYEAKPSSRTVAEGDAELNGNAVATSAVASARPGAEKTKNVAEAGMATTKEALKAAASAGKLVDTSAPVDQGTESNVLHDFELPITLAPLQRFGGPHGMATAFMARKQSIEARVGCQVPEDDGRRHSLTLTVGDYKRRRGLL